MRGRDPQELDRATTDLIAAFDAAGITGARIVEG